MPAFVPATRKRVKARLAIGGMSKSGKSFTALQMMRGIVGAEGRIAAIDTENGALSLYAGRFTSKRQPSGFDVMQINHFSPDAYIAAMTEAVKGKYDGLIIDSLSHEWMGAGGVLEIVDAAPSNDKFFTGWKNATPKHNSFVQAMVALPMHLIVTLRQKDDYVIEKNDKGQNAPVKVGTELIQRKGTEYEFNLVATMDLGHTLRVQHSCIEFLPNGTVIERPDGFALGSDLAKWLNLGDEEWTPPVFKKAFYIPTVNGPKEVMSAGVERETYVRIAGLGAALDKATKQKTAKSLMTHGVLADYTEEEAQAYMHALEARLEELKSKEEAA